MILETESKLNFEVLEKGTFSISDIRSFTNANSIGTKVEKIVRVKMNLLFWDTADGYKQALFLYPGFLALRYINFFFE